MNRGKELEEVQMKTKHDDVQDYIIINQKSIDFTTVLVDITTTNYIMLYGQ